MLFVCLLSLWSPACNIFIIHFGLLSITLCDISLLISLSLVGPDSPYFVDDHAAPTLEHHLYLYPSYRVMVKECASHTGTPYDTKHIMFLWY